MIKEPGNQPIKILIIEDDPIWRELITRLAKSLGYDAQTANSFEEVEEKLRQAETIGQPFSIVTIDALFKLGETNQEYYLGYEILRYIKSTYQNMPCILISGVSAVGSKVLDLREEYGLDYYIPKMDLNPKELEMRVQKAIARAEQLQHMETHHTLPIGDVTSAIDLLALRDVLLQAFNESELRDICFSLRVDYEEIYGEGKRDKTRELILYLERRGRISELVEICRQLRPNLP